MTNQPLPRAAEASRLTAALRRSALLGAGRVGDVVVGRSVAKQRSLTLRLLLTYKGEAPGAPRSAILKMGRHDKDGGSSYANEREIAFYRDIAPGLPERLTPCCFDATAADEAGPWHLLLEDLTDSHVIATEHPLPPTLAQCERIVKAWARLHAAMWDDPRLGVSVGVRPDAAWHLFLQRFPARFAAFTDRFGQIISPGRRSLYERLMERAPHLLAHYRSRRNVTLIHGDAHPWNCFLPRQGAGDVRLFDWESWSVDMGAADIASMMAMLWYLDLRRRTERPLLDLYHSELLVRGVRGYGARGARRRLPPCGASARPQADRPGRHRHPSTGLVAKP